MEVNFLQKILVGIFSQNKACNTHSTPLPLSTRLAKIKQFPEIEKNKHDRAVAHIFNTANSIYHKAQSWNHIF